MQTPHKCISFRSLFAAVSFGCALYVQAQYITGEQMRYDVLYNNELFPGEPFVVDSTPGAVEVPLSISGTMSFDLFDVGSYGEKASIMVYGKKNSTFAASPNVVRFTFPNLPVPAVTNVTLATTPSWPGMDGSRLRFGANYIDLDVGGLKNNISYSARVDFDNPRFHLPLLSIRVSQIQICWKATVNSRYQLQCCTNLGLEDWTNCGDPVAATSDPMCTTEPVADVPRFYRAVALP